MNNTIRASLLVVIAFGFASCGSGGNSAPPITKVTKVSIVTNEKAIFGGTINFTAKVEGDNVAQEVHWGSIQCGSRLENPTPNTIKIQVAETCASNKLVVTASAVQDATKSTSVSVDIENSTPIPPSDPNRITKESLDQWLTDKKVVAQTPISVCGQTIAGDPDNNWKQYDRAAEKILSAAVLEAPVLARVNGAIVEVYQVDTAFTAVLRSASSTMPAVTFSSPVCKTGAVSAQSISKYKLVVNKFENEIRMEIITVN